MRMTAQRRPAAQAGFTIIELLIATAVFSVILLVVTASILQFSKQYYKGTVSSATQGVARTLMDDVVRSIEFNGGDVWAISKGASKGYCVGTDKRYSYILGREVTDSGPNITLHQGYHGLVSDNLTGCGNGSPALDVNALPADLTAYSPALSNPRELLGQHMRLAQFDIIGSDPYTVTIKVVYGDDDLLSNPTQPSAACLSTAGSQYCAISQLQTTVKKRVN